MRNFIKILAWAKKYWYLLAFILIVTVLLEFTYSYVPYIIGFVLNVLADESESKLPKFLVDFFSQGDTKLEIIIYAAIALFFYQAIRFTGRFLESYYKGKLIENVNRDMRIKLYDHIQDLPYSYHNNIDTGDLIQRCTSDIEGASGFIANRFPQIFGLIATIVFGAIRVHQISPLMMWISLIVIPIAGLCSTIYFAYVQKEYEAIEEIEAKMMTIIQENVSGVKVVKACANEKYEIDKLEEINEYYTMRNQKFIKAMAMYWGTMDVVVYLQFIVTLVIGVNLMKNNEINIGDMTSVLMLLGMLIWPIRGLGRIISDFGKTLVSIKRIEEILTIQSEYQVNGIKKPPITGKITFENVKFKFEDEDKELLKGISFQVNQGENIAIVGKTGSGKSTLAYLMTRLLEFHEGKILFDDVDIKEIDKHYLRKNVGIVLQDPFLFSKTVYDNISIADKKAEFTEIERVAKIASIDSDIKNFEKGYKTIVGEKGTTLSGGQKQRVAIARMLVEKKPIIIFDDSLSAVDTETDLKIRTSLKNKDNQTTMFIITHRITTAKEADRIVVLDKGVVEAVGTHEELVNISPLYKKLWDIQGKLELEFKKFLQSEVK